MEPKEFTNFSDALGAQASSPAWIGFKYLELKVCEGCGVRRAGEDACGPKSNLISRLMVQTNCCRSKGARVK
jgi:hypothetical protein